MLSVAYLLNAIIVVFDAMQLLYLFVARVTVNVSINAMLMDEGGLFLAALVDKAGCGVRHATGVFFWIFSGKQQWLITSDLCKLSS